MNVIEYLQSEYDYEEFQNSHRFGGVVDIYKKNRPGKSTKKRQGVVAVIFIIPENKFYYPKSVNQQMDIVINHIEFYKDLRKKKSMPDKPRYTFQAGGRAQGKTAGALKRVPAGWMKDDSLMPFGKHQGDKMIDVPADYLIWLFENDKCNAAVRAYVQANEDVLRLQARQIKKR